MTYIFYGSFVYMTSPVQQVQLERKALHAQISIVTLQHSTFKALTKTSVTLSTNVIQFTGIFMPTSGLVSSELCFCMHVYYVDSSLGKQ